jgi:uncharacterized C2H2 Zn-finger protein
MLNLAALQGEGAGRCPGCGMFSRTRSAYWDHLAQCERHLATLAPNQWSKRIYIRELDASRKPLRPTPALRRPAQVYDSRQDYVHKVNARFHGYVEDCYLLGSADIASLSKSIVFP